ncbi:hypothetical protein Lser_V15G06960 [Lactuca serriola]
MANLNQQQISIKPWILEVVPFIVLVLIAAHVIALGLLDIQISYGKAPWTKKEALDLLLLLIHSSVVTRRIEGELLLEAHKLFDEMCERNVVHLTISLGV